MLHEDRDVFKLAGHAKIGIYHVKASLKMQRFSSF